METPHDSKDITVDSIMLNMESLSIDSPSIDEFDFIAEKSESTLTRSRRSETLETPVKIRNAPSVYTIPKTFGVRFDETEELTTLIFQAAQETADAHYDTTDEFEMRRLVFKNCQKIAKLDAFRKLLSSDPNLVHCRATNLEHLAPDGLTPLHAASQHNNLDAVTVLVSEFYANTWARDLKGRTALHIAAENGHHSICSFLRSAMLDQSKVDPVGPHAPIDLAGITPLGGACHRKRGVVPEIASILFSPGDRTILPKTPHSKRVGKSPWRSKKLGVQDFVFAFSEAQGWSRRMEDRSLISSPVVGCPSISLFAVFDGHGGSFCSQFLADNFASILSKVCNEITGSNDTPYSFSETELRSILLKACEIAESELRQHPRLKVTKVGAKYQYHDSSGSTGVIALVTTNFVAVANVGDSRAVLASLKKNEAMSIATEDALPFDSHQICMKPLSYDHKYNIPAECRRALASGAKVQRLKYRGASPADGIESVELKLSDAELSFDYWLKGSFEVITSASDSKLRMSRSFGDFSFKMNENIPIENQAVVATPEIIVHKRGSRDLFVVLACDGIWDVMSNDEVCNFVGDQLSGKVHGRDIDLTCSATEACDNLLAEAMKRGSQDNLTAVIVMFPKSFHSSDQKTLSNLVISTMEESTIFDLLDESSTSIGTPISEVRPATILIMEKETGSDEIITPEVSRHLEFSNS